MSFTAGHNVQIYVGGTATAMVAEATTEVTPGVIYQVTNTAKRVINPGAALSVDDAGGPVPAGNYTVNYFTGTLTFTVAPTAPVTLTAEYMPLLEVATCNRATINTSRAALDTSTMKGSPEPSALPGMFDVGATMTDLEPADVDLDPGAGTTRLVDFIIDGTPMLFKAALGNGRAFYGWGHLFGRDRTAPVKDLVAAEMRWQASQQRAFGRSELVCFAINEVA